MLFTVGSKDDIRVMDSASKRRVCSTHAPIWDSLIDAADWRDRYQKDKDLFAVFAVWGKDTRKVEGAPYRQTTEPFNAVHIDTELPEWMYLFCNGIISGVLGEGVKEFYGDTGQARLKIIALDALLRFDFLV